MGDGPVVFAIESYGYLQQEICRRSRFEGGEVERRVFPDGERYQRIRTPVDGRDAVIVGGTVSDADTLDLYDLACGLVQHDARSLTMVIPFFGYATMERAVHPGEVVTAKTRARLLSSVPVPGWGSRVVLLDLHSEGIPYYFEGGVRPFHLRATPVILEAARRLGSAGDRPSRYVLACTDAGRAKWVEALANDLGVGASFVFKRRHDDGRTEVSAVSAQVEGAHVLLYDDMIRTGGSLIGAARAYLAAGARCISAITTHGIFPGDALARLRASGLFETVVCTDTHPRAMQLRDDFLKVESVAGLIADYLRSEFASGD